MTAYNKLHNKQDMVGRVFNKWTVLEYSHQAAHSGNWFYLCQCTCGKQGTVQGTKLRNNKSSQCKSCTCKANGRKGIYAKNVGTDLYVIKCNDHYYKIGTTLNIEGRLKTIKSNNPYELTCVYYGKERGEEEEYWHSFFKKHHWEGEWFVFNDAQAVKAVSDIAAGQCEI